MAFSIDFVQEEILNYLRTNLAQPVIEQGIPDIQTVQRDAAGKIVPFYALQFGDIQQTRTSNRSMIGPRGDDYIQPVYTQAVSPDPRIARRMGNRINDLFLGMVFPWSGSVRKRPEGWMYPITTSTGSTEAYEMPASFGVLVQLSNEA